jgi:hypothetical protein
VSGRDVLARPGLPGDAEHRGDRRCGSVGPGAIVDFGRRRFTGQWAADVPREETHVGQ